VEMLVQRVLAAETTTISRSESASLSSILPMDSNVSEARSISSAPKRMSVAQRIMVAGRNSIARVFASPDRILGSKLHEDVSALINQMRAYRMTLTDIKRQEFDDIWGLAFGSLTDADDVPVSRGPRYWLRHFSSNKNLTSTLTTQINLIRNEVVEEYYFFNNNFVSAEKKGQRLLYLFSKDMLVSTNKAILHNKAQRGKQPQKRKWSEKALGWTFLVLLNLGLLFYVMLFALQKSPYKQKAWFLSFVVWLLLEIFIVSCAVVFLTHILIPSWIMRDLKKLKQFLMDEIMDYRDRVGRMRDIELENEDRLLIRPDEFNVANYMFVSTRLARMFPDLYYSPIILKYRTVFPSSTLLMTKDVSKGYSRKFGVIMQSFQRVFIFLITSFVHFPVSFQDMIIQMVSSGGLGYVVLLHMQMYRINPMLPFLPIAVLCILVHFYVTTDKHGHKLHLTRVVPMVDSEPFPSKAVAEKGDDVRPANEVDEIEHAWSSDLYDESKFDLSDLDSSEISESDAFGEISSVSGSDD